MVLPARAIELGLHVIYGESGRARIVADSRRIAEVFSKRHADVLESVGKLLANGNVRSLNLFRSSEYTDTQGKPRPCFDLTRDGVVLLVMGYDGERALELKLAYMGAFNDMEDALGREQPDFVEHLTRIEGKVDATLHVVNSIQQKKPDFKPKDVEIWAKVLDKHFNGKCPDGCGYSIMRDHRPITKTDVLEPGEAVWTNDHCNREQSGLYDGMPAAMQCNLRRRDQAERDTDERHYTTFKTMIENFLRPKQKPPFKLTEPTYTNYTVQPNLFDGIPK